MKQLIIIIVALLTLCFASCRHKNYPQALLEVDSISNVHPDSALQLLNRYKSKVTEEPEYVRMYYNLLTVKTADKAYITHTSDSLIKEVINYYEKNDKLHLSEAYYYGGRVYADLGDAPQALDYYQNAINALKEMKRKDYDLLSRIYSQMCILFLDQDVYEEALKSIRQSYKYDVLLNDTDGIIRNLIYTGKVFSAFHNVDSAVYYYKRSMYMAQRYGDYSLKNDIFTTLSNLYFQQKEYDYAKAYADSIISPKHYQQRVAYLLKAEVALKQHQLDSAEFYYKKELQFDDIYGKQAGYIGLSNIARERRDIANALIYLDKYNKVSREIIDKNNTESIRKMQSLYNYNIREQQNKDLKEETLREQQMIKNGIILFTICIIIILTYIIYNRQKENRIEKQILRAEEKYQKSQEYIEKQKLRLVGLKSDLEKMNISQEKLHDIVKLYEDRISLLSKKLQMKEKEQTFSDVILFQSEIYKKFCEAADNNAKVTDEDWTELQKLVNVCYPDFSSNVHQLYTMKEEEYKKLLLTKLNFNINGIANITIASLTTIYSFRTRSAMKIFGRKTSSDEWNAFIKSL